MNVTYAVIIKKEYQDIVTTLSNNIYEVIDVYDDYELADNGLKNAEGIVLANLNRIDSKGLLKGYQTKILPLEGSYDKTQAQTIVNILKDKIFNKNNKVL